MLKFSSDFDDYLPMVRSRWEGTELMNFSPLIYGDKVENVAITGRGLIDGNGEPWWRTYRQIKEQQLGKPVRVSSYKQKPPDGHDLLDGRPGFTFAVETNVEDSPSVVVDLLSEHAIERIVIHNRADGWWDDCLPLVVELSRDDKTYTELARREKNWKLPEPRYTSGFLAKYARLAQGAELGAITNT